MALKDVALWWGRFESLYDEELKVWLSSRETEGPIVVDCGATPADLSNPDGLWRTITAEAIWITQPMGVVFRAIEEWTEDELAAVLEYLDTQEIGWHVALIQHSADVGDVVPEFLTEKVHNYGVPFDYDDRAEWACDWMDAREVELLEDLAYDLAVYTGEDVDSFVTVLRNLVALDLDRDIEWSDIEPYLAKAGSVPMWDLTTAIVSGDRVESLRVLQRLLTTYAPLQLVGLLTNRWRQYSALILDEIASMKGNEMAKAAGVSPKALRYVLAEAEKLGVQRIVKTGAMIAKASSDLKGESLLPPDLILEILVVRLAQQFELAAGGRAGYG